MTNHRSYSFPLTFSVVIPAYNEENGIEACLESVLAQTIEPLKVIVVNDGSTDSTPEILRRYSDRITVLNLEENTGNKALALREAIPYLEGDIVVYTDADSVLDPKAMERMLIHFLDRDVGGISGFVRSKAHNLITGIREIQYIYGQEILKRGMGVINAVPVIPGCVGAVRRELFDPPSETMTEDMDMTLSILRDGYRVVFEPKAIVWTSDPPNLRSYVKQSVRWYAGYFQNFKKHFLNLPKRVKLQMAVSVLDNSLFSILLLATLFLQLITGDGSIPIALFAIEMSLWFVLATHATLTRRRSDLLGSLLIAPLFRVIDSAIWTYSLIREIFLKKGDFRWHRSDKIKLSPHVH